MNVAWTQAAEGLPRRAFTVDDVRRMVAIGVIGEDESFELVEGEFVMVASKSIAHENIKHFLVLALAKAVPEGVYLGVEATLQLSNTVLVEPDIAIIKRSVYKADPKGFAQPTADDILLVVEVAASSMTYDRGVKARLYTRHGIREFWVIDANERVTWVHTQSSGDTWGSIVKRGPSETLTTPALPGFAIRLAEID